MKNFALLIDGENVAGKNLDFILDTLKERGNIQEKIVFANFENIAHQESWNEAIKKNPMQKHSILPIGKEAADTALIIKAMEFLYDKPSIDAFCLVSSDSGFATLARYLREKNKFVMGMGDENRSNQDWIGACDYFELLPVFNKKLDETEASQKVHKLNLMFTRVFNKFSENNQPILLARFGRLLREEYPNYDIKDYPFNSLSDAIKNSTWFRLEIDPSSQQNHKIHKFFYSSDANQKNQKTTQENREERKTKVLLLNSFNSIFELYAENECISMATFGEKLKKTFPSFKVKDYGFSTLSKAFVSLPEFELVSDGNKKQPNYTIYRSDKKHSKLLLKTS